MGTLRVHTSAHVCDMPHIQAVAAHLARTWSSLECTKRSLFERDRNQPLRGGDLNAAGAGISSGRRGDVRQTAEHLQRLSQLACRAGPYRGDTKQ